MFEKNTNFSIRNKPIIGFLVFVPICLLPFSAKTQTQAGFTKLSMQQAVEAGVTNNPLLKNSSLEIQLAKAEKGEIIEFSPTGFNYQYGEINTAINDKFWTINQNVGSLITPIYKSKYVKSNIEVQTLKHQLMKNKLIAEIKTAYHNWVYAHNRLNLLFEEKNIYSDFNRISELRYKLGETDLLEKTISQTRSAGVNIFL